MSVCALLPALALTLATQARAPELSAERVLLETSLGDLVLALYPTIAPRNAEQVLRLVRLGVYDGTDFFRVEEGFVAQAGVMTGRLTPLSSAQQAAIVQLPAEFSKQPHVRGTVTMARYDDNPNSATTSFSIVLGAAPHLDGKYTVVGRLEEGWDTLARIERVQKEGSRPTRRITIERATVLEPPSAAQGERLLAGSLVAAALALVASIGFWRARLPRARSAAMLALLLSVFGAMMGGMWARAPLPDALALLLFLGAVAMFRYLATFEAPARRAG